jgi:hypothetical protein
MSDEMAGFAGGLEWLPARVQRAMAVEDARERAEAKRADAEREARREQKHETALALYRQQCDDRGEYVSALALARGEVTGRTLGDIMADAQASADRDNARAAARDRYKDGGDWCYIGSGEPVIREPVSRSEIVNEYELSRAIAQLEDGRTWMAGYMMRLASRCGQAAEHIEAVREARGSSPTSTLTSRQAPTGQLTIQRVMPDAVTAVW